MLGFDIVNMNRKRHSSPSSATLILSPTEYSLPCVGALSLRVTFISGQSVLSCEVLRQLLLRGRCSPSCLLHSDVSMKLG